MFYALVNTLEYSKWCMKKESMGEFYTYNAFMKEYLSTEGTTMIRWNVPENEQAGFVNINNQAGWWENSWILVKYGWCVKYNFSHPELKN